MMTKNQRIDVDQLMEQVRQELGRPAVQRSGGQGVQPSAGLPIDEVLDRVRSEVEMRKRNTDAGGGKHFSTDDSSVVRWHPVTPRPRSQHAYTLSELLRHDDADFVETAYRILLQRTPDAGGIEHYLHELRSGSLSKIEILGRLRWSAEGRERDVHVDGLLKPYLVQRGRRLPVLGPLASWAIAFIRLGAHRHQQAMRDVALAQETHSIGRLLNHLADNVMPGLRAIDRRQLVHVDEIAVMGRQLEQLAEALTDLQERVTRIEASAEDRERRAAEELKALDPLYVAFEDQFRGGRDLVRARAEPYLPLVEATGAGTAEAVVLDIGCGRGEWLELLREKGLNGVGIDLNSMFIANCRALDLNVIEGDAIESLRHMATGSVGAITSMHLVEHLPFEKMIALLDEAGRVLRTGGVLILETPNPENLSVGSHTFYMDPTHRNPLPPEALRWLVEARGFADARVERLSANRELNAPALLPDTIPGAASVNVLLASLNASPDYAIVAYKR